MSFRKIKICTLPLATVLNERESALSAATRLLKSFPNSSTNVMNSGPLQLRAKASSGGFLHHTDLALVVNFYRFGLVPLEESSVLDLSDSERKG